MLKKAHHRKAVWMSDENPDFNLEKLIRISLNKKLTVQSTRFKYSDKTDVQISDRQLTDFAGCFFTAFIEGDSAETVKVGQKGLGSISAPEGEEFLKSGIYMTISKNDIAYVALSSTNDGQLNLLVHKFLQFTGVDETECNFIFAPMANRDEVTNLLSQGVKSIDLGIADFATAIDQINDNENQTIFTKLKKSINEAIREDATAAEREAASQILAKIQIKLDLRSNSKILLQTQLAEISKNIYNDGFNEFKFVTSNDEIITPERLAIKTDVHLALNDGNIISSDVFEKLFKELSKWRNSGVLE